MHAGGGFARVGNWAEYKVTTIAASMGFRLENLMVEGRNYTDPDAIKAIINLQKGDPIFSFDPHEAKDMIERLAWVRGVRIQRRLPDTIYIALEERKPIALWQRHGHVSVIDKDGKILSDHDLEQFKDFVIVTGEGAAEEAFDLLQLLKAEPVLYEKTEAAMFVASRRWDLKLKDGKEIKLPEENIAIALRRLVSAHENKDILDRDLIAIDLRQVDRMIVSTTTGTQHTIKTNYVNRASSGPI